MESKTQDFASRTGKYPKLAKLKEIVDNNNISITKLSSESGVTRETIYRYMKGQVRPLAPKLVLISRVISRLSGQEITVNDFFEDFADEDLE